MAVVQPQLLDARAVLRERASRDPASQRARGHRLRFVAQRATRLPPLRVRRWAPKRYSPIVPALSFNYKVQTTSGATEELRDRLSSPKDADDRKCGALQKVANGRWKDLRPAPTATIRQ